MVNEEIGGKSVELSYDTGSQFSIITKQIYDFLPCKPHLVEVKQSGIGTDSHKFTFEWIAYLLSNTEFQEVWWYRLPIILWTHSSVESREDLSPDLSHVLKILNNKL